MAPRPGHVSTTPVRAQMEEQFRQLQRQIEKLETKKIQEVEAKANAALEASKKTFVSQFNPAISLGIDTIGSYKSNAQGFNPGNGPQAGARINNARPSSDGGTVSAVATAD